MGWIGRRGPEIETETHDDSISGSDTRSFAESYSEQMDAVLGPCEPSRWKFLGKERVL
ncbi:hypothetical protein SISSUDRAFT_1050983 [Sistotremastrum suecicum HHB10207 ss-3]|uniref:Uncharacterized protein n=1 Tax=Sistotremastrum suecicum HHB10207 ss-3 TaxID=1314776 RepID=A0A166AV97_9AGAM|nr:hypothetical protein SISSUDRAFT_1050983 [Sistotremastrum suecicum HHB10207 ss-3]